MCLFDNALQYLYHLHAQVAMALVTLFHLILKMNRPKVFQIHLRVQSGVSCRSDISGRVWCRRSCGGSGIRA